MSKEVFRLFLVFVIVALLAGGAFLGYHFSRQHQVCTASSSTIPPAMTCKTEYG